MSIGSRCYLVHSYDVLSPLFAFLVAIYLERITCLLDVGMFRDQLRYVECGPSGVDHKERVGVGILRGHVVHTREVFGLRISQFTQFGIESMPERLDATVLDLFVETEYDSKF